MVQQFSAVVEGGLLRPKAPLGLQEGTQVDLILVLMNKKPVEQGDPAKILAEIAALPTQGGDPQTSEEHDQVLYNGKETP